jgi:hypothetical protein
MTSPRSFDGVGYRAPSFFSDTPIYDSLVAERGVPQIAPINVPAALPPAPPSPYEMPRYGGHESGSNLPALARPALGPGPSAAHIPTPTPAPQYAAPQVPPGYGYPQPHVPGHRFPGPQQNPPQGAPAMPAQSQPAPGYPNSQGLSPVAPVRPMPQRPAPSPYGEQPYPRGGYQGGY